MSSRRRRDLELEISACASSALASPRATDPALMSVADRIRALDRSPWKTTHPGRDATRDTTPWHLWHSSVLEIAGVSSDEAERYATRGRIQRAYQAGEPAYMAADMVRLLVRGGLIADRADDEVAGLRRAALGAARRPGRRSTARGA